MKNQSELETETASAALGGGTGMLNAQCFCGAVRFTVEDAFAYAFYCHCSRCRRRTGAACAAIGGIASEKVHVMRGDEYVLKLDESERGYVAVCKQCCSPLYSVVNAGKFVHVPLGVLDGAPSKAPDHHIQVASKAEWHSIKDGLPQFAAFPP